MAEARHVAETRHVAADRVPTLTEVVELGGDFVPANLLMEMRLGQPADVKPLQRAGRPPAQADELSAEVLFELEQRIDSLFEARLREALAPALARATDGLIREARQELSVALREMFEDAVTRSRERRTHL